MTVTLSAEIAASAARLIVEEGLEYGAAKRRAAATAIAALCEPAMRPF